jgi:hypothetical protein
MNIHLSLEVIVGFGYRTTGIAIPCCYTVLCYEPQTKSIGLLPYFICFTLGAGNSKGLRNPIYKPAAIIPPRMGAIQ